MKGTFVCIALLAVGGCRTMGGATVKDAGSLAGGAGVDCVFASPRNQTEKLEVWAVPGDNNGIKALKARYDANVDAPGQVRDYGTPPVVDKKTITQQERRELRSFFKGLTDVEFSKFSCVDLVGNGGSSGAASYFCLGNGKTANGEREALWITNQSSQKFAAGLTTYQTHCAAPQ